MRTPTLALTALMLTAACREGRPVVDAGRDGGSSPFDAGDCTPSPENTVAACADGVSNDCDQFIDCNDLDCCGVVACPPTTTCGMRDGGMRPPVCPTMGPEDTEAACTDGCDNDNNGFADCTDFDCCAWRTDCAAGTACGDGPQLCETRGEENTLGRCTDMCDNDGRLGDRRFADCEDRACCLVRAAGGMACPGGSYCADTFDPMGTTLCPGDDVMQEPGTENTLAACSNDCDDNRNGFQDCADRGCCLIRIAGGTPCASGTYCSDMFMPGDVSLCPGDDVAMAPTTEDDATKCGNSCDDDRDGFEDCEDRDCCTVRTDCPSDTFCGRTTP